MESFRIEILNPKALKLIKDLADLNLISITDSSQNNFLKLLKNLRSKSKNTPPLDTITKEVEAVRAKRYGK